MPGINDTSFVEQEHYTPYPTSDASPKDWTKWLEKEKRKRAAHKATHTKSLEYAPEPTEFQSTSMHKIGGVWRQGAQVGFTGSTENNTLAIERAEDAKQEHHIALIGMEACRNKRGGNNRAGKSKRRRANKKRREREARKGKK